MDIHYELSARPAIFSPCLHHVSTMFHQFHHDLSTICFHPGTRIVRHFSSFLIIFHDVPSFSTIVQPSFTVFPLMFSIIFHWCHGCRSPPDGDLGDFGGCHGSGRRGAPTMILPMENGDFVDCSWWFHDDFMLIDGIFIGKNDELIYGTYSNIWWLPTLGLPREFSSISNDGIFPGFWVMISCWFCGGFRTKGVYPIMDGLFRGESQSKMDDNWGYCHV